MIRLEKPKFNQEEIITDCIANMKEGTLKQHISDSKNEIVRESADYDQKACLGKLSHILAHTKLKSGALKDDMIKLYETKFVPERQGGRKYYDAIKLLSPNNRCPYCAQREVSTLDHYLPKAKYPTYAVTPFNLVPSCRNCNSDKLGSTFNCRIEETIHPYYDDFSKEKWIAAELMEEEPIAFEFSVQCPDNWDNVKKARAKNHFEKFRLNNLYKPYASEEFEACFNRIKRLYKRGGKELAIESLKEDIEDKEVIRLNTWQAAMYQAIIDSDWFWDIYLPKAEL
nr:hypothetical protein [uncultured Acetatifactor sp.]